MCSISMMREPEEEVLIFFPCIESRICPYGALVEQFPLAAEVEDTVEEPLICDIYGHVCPYHYVAELI